MAEEQQESSQGEMEGVNCLAYDEAIIAQQDRIQQEIANSNPLVSDRQDLSVLQREYADDDTVYQLKIKDLYKKYSYIRKTRPDGNCFYRAFGFAHLESLLDDSKELQKFKAVASKSKLDLVNEGFTEFTIEDFHNTFMDLIELCEKQPNLQELLNSFNDQNFSLSHHKMVNKKKSLEHRSDSRHLELYRFFFCGCKCYLLALCWILFLCYTAFH
ncbi:ubiquitin thioesterase OTUB1-like [Xyrichtys novacula]|uniref:ubiquitinyl hydrolase 1 n=1 Tax=Xyrichtys novacula TaxID=13765 RepID=A0AAV1HLC2_XYRNO|nr:ubiquitin thioesterase OTUB1-like [Xyrichtys novacula]